MNQREMEEFLKETNEYISYLKEQNEFLFSLLTDEQREQFMKRYSNEIPF